MAVGLRSDPDLISVYPGPGLTRAYPKNARHKATARRRGSDGLSAGIDDNKGWGAAVAPKMQKNPKAAKPI